MNSFKLVVLGSSAAGKTSIVHRYVNGIFDENEVSTIGAWFRVKKVQCPDGSELRLDIWDTAGSERYDNITPIYYRKANACLIVYDISDLTSYDRAKYWVNTLLNAELPNIIIILVGNKIDLEALRKVKKEDAEHFASSHKLLHIEVSAKTNQNIEKLFMKIISTLILVSAQKDDDIIDLNNDNKVLDKNNKYTNCFGYLPLKRAFFKSPF